MTDDLIFEPDEATITPGSMIVWENVRQVGHSVTAYEDTLPDGAEFFSSGDLESEEAARRAYPREGDIAEGESYQHTFDVEGEYEYFCIPHEGVGMVASLTVTSEPQDDGEIVPALPGSAVLVGIATTTALVVIVALAYFFIKYGGDYGEE